MKSVRRRRLALLPWIALLWGVLATILFVGGMSPIRGRYFPDSFRIGHPAILMWLEFLLGLIWILGPSWIVLRVYSGILRNTLPTINEARELIARYGAVLEGGPKVGASAQLPAPILEIEKAFQVVIAQGGLDDTMISAMRTAFSSLVDWDEAFRFSSDGLSEYQRRDRQFGEWLGEAGNPREQLRMLMQAASKGMKTQ